MNLILPTSRNAAAAVAPFRPLAEFEREIDRLFGGQLTGASQVSASSLAVPLDIHENSDSLVVAADLPGVRKEDITVAFEDGVLTLAAERRVAAEQKEDGYLRRERYQGRFERRLAVRTPINPDAVKATYKDGVLTVTLPKTEVAKPKQIRISDN